jgi:basic membrane protein A
MGTYFGAAEEARYLSGIAAGHATQNGKIGYVAAFPIPEVLRGINAFALGARSVNPDATVQVVWTKTWFGPDEEKQAAESLTAEGVDVLAMHQDTPSTGEAAADVGAKWLGYNDDMSSFQPEAWLTGPVWDWGPYYTQTAQSVLDGTCPTDQYYGTMADGMVGLASYGESMDQAWIDHIEAVKATIIDGSFKPFTGPINDQDGNEKVAAGESPDLGTLLGMDYLVEGVIGSPTG